MATSKKQDGASDDSSRTAASEAGAAATAATTTLVQRQMASAAEWMSSMFRAGERMQQAQLHMAQRAALLHSQAADNIRKATNPMDLMTIQTTLMLYEAQEGMRYMQELMLESAKMGRQVADRLHEDQAGDGSGSQASSSSAATSPMEAAAPILQAWQQVFNGAMNSVKPH
jgi:hypothetical protein